MISFRLVGLVLGFLLVIWGCFLKQESPPLNESFQLNRSQALSDLNEFTKSAHPFGSPRQADLASWLAKRLENDNIAVSLDRFVAQVPNKLIYEKPMANPTTDILGSNVFALLDLAKSSDCVVLVASHFDSKDIQDFSYLGANDSGSSSILLLQIGSYFKNLATRISFKCDIGLVWFDGEESVLAGWTDGELHHPAKIVDHTYGSRHFANELVKCQDNKWCLKDKKLRIEALILLDMIGMPNVSLTREALSDPKLWLLVDEGAKILGLTSLLSGQSVPVDDDHLPFVKKSIPAINLIDFNHLQSWHKPNDTVEHLSLDSIEKVGKLAVWLAQKIASEGF